ncbi:MAG: hypothetical protein WD398_06705 [Cyclobacteriaceae bacterium]
MMPYSFYFILLFLGFIVSGAFLLIKNQPSEYNKINVVVFLVLMASLLSEYIWEYTKVDGSNSYLLYNLLYVYLKPTLMLLLYTQLPFSCGLENKIFPTLVIFIGIGVLNSMYFQPLAANIQSYTYLIGHGLVLFYSIIFFKDILTHRRYSEINLLSLPYFWIAALILFSFGEGYIFFILTYYFPPLGSFSMGHVFQWVRFSTSVMYLSMGMAFFAPLVFRRGYSY